MFTFLFSFMFEPNGSDDKVYEVGRRVIDRMAIKRIRSIQPLTNGNKAD